MSFVCFCASPDCAARGCARLRTEGVGLDATSQTIKWPPNPIAARDQIAQPCVRPKTPQERAADLLEEAARILRGVTPTVLVLLLASCGPAPAEAKPLPPNTEQACLRAEQCGVFLPEQRDACVACLEHVDQALLAKLESDYGPLPPLEQADCATVTAVCQAWTNIASCVVGRWYGP